MTQTQTRRTKVSHNTISPNLSLYLNPPRPRTQARAKMSAQVGLEPALIVVNRGYQQRVHQARCRIFAQARQTS